MCPRIRHRNSLEGGNCRRELPAVDFGAREAASCRPFLPALPLLIVGDSIMKDGIHPDYIHTVVRCGCGNTFATRSTVPEIKVDICNACHPFFTGKLKFVDTAGRIEKFKTKFAGAGYASLKKKKAAAEASAS